MNVQLAIDLLKANGYRVSKPKAKTVASQFNALGLPRSANYDPNYKIKHKVTSIKRLYAPQNFPWKQ